MQLLDTRRNFLQSAACAAPGLTGAVTLAAQTSPQSFRTAYESIKPTDVVFIGLFPRAKDEIRENAERVHRLLTKV